MGFNSGFKGLNLVL